MVQGDDRSVSRNELNFDDTLIRGNLDNHHYYSKYVKGVRRQRIFVIITDCKLTHEWCTVCDTIYEIYITE